MIFITAINLITSLTLGFCLTMFYIYLYGDDSKVVHKWSFVGHWSLKLGMVGMIIGILLKIWNLDTPTIHELIFDVGLTLVFLWAYLFHRQLFKDKIK